MSIIIKYNIYISWTKLFFNLQIDFNGCSSELVYNSIFISTSIVLNSKHIIDNCIIMIATTAQ